MSDFQPTHKTQKDLIYNIIDSYTFLDYGIVDKYTDKTVDVILVNMRSEQELKLTGVELLTLGSASCSVTIEPTKGDLVLLLALRNYIEDLSVITSPESRETKLHYDLANIKAIQIAPARESKATLDIDKDGNVKIDSPSISLNGDSKYFVTHAELDSAIQTFITALNTHVHPTAATGPASPPLVGMSLNIASAKTITIKTGG